MLLLRLHTPVFPLEQKKIMVAELTDALSTCLRLEPEERERVAIQFIPYDPMDLAVGGRFVSETEEPVYYLALQDSSLSPTQRAKLPGQLQPLLLDLLGLPASEAHRVVWLFAESGFILADSR